MAFPAPDLRFSDIPGGLGAVSLDLHLAFDVRKGSFDLPFEHQMRAGIGQKDVWNRAGKTQVGRPALRRPRSLQQPALLMLPAAKVISEEIAAFFAGGGTHQRD